MGKDADDLIRRMMAPAMEAKMDASASEARALSLFGSPQFVSGNEVFWGDDRLADAIDWVKRQPIT